MKEKLKNHYTRKFGETIFNDLVSPDFRLKAENIKRKGYGKEAVDNQMALMINEDLISEEQRSKFNWAFDFPGWIGELDLNKEHRKEIMLIQLEPHVEDYDYQVVYELAESTGKREFGIQENNEKLITRSTRPIWDNMTRLLTSQEQRIDIFKNKNTSALYSILEKIYVTDMCHFAPQGPTTLLNQLPWNKIRSAVARKFMFEEIELINPKLLIASGLPVIKAVTKILKGNSRKQLLNPSDLTPNNYKSFPYLYEYEIRGKKQLVLFMPHVGTINPSNGTFWRKSVDNFNILLREKGVLVN